MNRILFSTHSTKNSHRWRNIISKIIKRIAFAICIDMTTMKAHYGGRKTSHYITIRGWRV